MIESEHLYDFTFHLVNPEDKDEKWCLEYIKSRYPLWNNFFSTPFWNGRTDYATIRSYGRGQQSEMIYKQQFDPQGYMKSTAGGRPMIDWAALSWNIVNPLPKYKNIILANLERQTYPEVQCEAVDDLAKNKKQEKKLMIKFQKQIDEDLKEISAKMKLPKPMKSNMTEKAGEQQPDPSSALKDIEFDFDNDVEFNMYISMYWREAVEIANELCIQTLFELNEYPEILKEVRNDAIDFGIAAQRIYMDNNTCMPKIEWLRLEGLVAGWGRRRDFKDIEGWAYNDMMTVNQIIGKFGKELSRDTVLEIFKFGISTYGYYDGSSYNTNWNQGQISWDKIVKSDLDKVKVKVAYFEFLSQNCETTEYSKGKYNTTKAKKRKNGYKSEKEDSKVEQEWAQVVYKGYYVVGMDKIFQYGMLNNMVREEGNEQQVMFSLSMYKFADKSITEHCIPHLDGIQLASLKFQLELKQAVPSGWAFDIDRLAEISMGDSGKLDELEVMRMFTQTGRFPYKSIDDNGNPLPASATGALPISPLPNGVSVAIQGYIAAIQFHVSQIEMLIGYNSITAGGAPEARQALGGIKIAQAASDNATYYLVSGLNTMIENCARYMGSMIMDMATYGGYGWESFKRMIGNANADVVESMDKIAMHKFGIFVKEKMSDEEMNQFKQFIMDAYQKQEIDLSDVLMVWFLKDYKQAIQLFNIKRNKQKRAMAESAQAQMQMQQQQIMSQNQLTAALAQMDKESRAQVAQITGQFNLQQEEMKQKGKIQNTQVQGINKNRDMHDKGMIDSILKQQESMQST